MPLAMSALLAVLLTSPSRFFERQGFPRGYAALISVILALMVVVLILFLIGDSIASFRNDLPQMKENINDSIRQLQEWVGDRLRMSTRKVREMMNNSAANNLPSTSNIVNSAVTTATAVVFVGIIVFIQTFLLLLYRGLVVRFVVAIFSESYTPVIHELFIKIRVVIRSYLTGLFIETAIVAGLFAAAFFLLGVKYALLLAGISALLNIIPYLGIVMACVLCTLITLTTNSPATVLWVNVALILIHMVDSNILMPRIVGSKVNINALATIVGVVIGSALWGIPGTFLAVPIMAILKVLFEAVPAFQPLAMVMGDDIEVSAGNNFIVKKITKQVIRK